MTADINEILAQRKGTHGSFAENARVVEALLNVYRSAPNWDKLPDTAREVMHMIAHKQARILSGNPHEPDHWLDISGYSKLEHDECVRRATQVDAAVKMTETKHAAAGEGTGGYRPGAKPSFASIPDTHIASVLSQLKPGSTVNISGHAGAVLIQPRDGELARMTCDCIAVCYEADVKDGTGDKTPTIRYLVDRNKLTLDALERFCLPRLTADPTWKEYSDLPPWYRVLYEKKPGAERHTILPHFLRWTTV